ncbi:OLC1v1028172C1 [Oldenlandia corymbosa var. corymbosa]|uniref:OLC1v1028172C1 n=1 Tax=Oldenlandia corymbosa var. corymbosa TaxID=529605 RepID=A0AAV1CDU4_OLDCO|nr:OLC1v1028172C1 [Oldenlandia corymbosa var. corymbosa]
MNPRVVLVVAILMICIYQISSDAETEEKLQEQSMVVVRGANRRLLPLMDCGGLCSVRCGLHSRPNLCKRACGTCCFRCKCVPPGTSGNRELCGTCYTDMTTHGNRTKMVPRRAQPKYIKLSAGAVEKSIPFPTNTSGAVVWSASPFSSHIQLLYKSLPPSTPGCFRFYNGKSAPFF